MNELELLWLLLKLVCFASGLLAGTLIGYATLWLPLNRALQRELTWQALHAAQVGPLMTPSTKPDATPAVAIWWAAVWQVVQLRLARAVRHDR